MLSRWVALLTLVAATASIARAQVAPDDSSKDTAAAWIGVSVAAGTTDTATGARGVRIGSVETGGPADRAGIRSGDLVTQVDGRAVREPDAFVRSIRAHDSGKRIRLTIVREGRTKSLEVTAGTAPNEPEVMDEPGSAGDWRRQFEPRSPPRLGVEVMGLDEDLAAYFGTQAGGGLLVTRVVAGSGAAAAGIKAGDVLLRLENRTLSEVDDLHTALEHHATGERLEIALRRHGRAVSVVVEIGAAEVASADDALRRWTQRRAAPGAFMSSGDVEELRRELRELKRDMDALKRDLLHRH